MQAAVSSWALGVGGAAQGPAMRECGLGTPNVSYFSRETKKYSN